MNMFKLKMIHCIAYNTYIYTYMHTCTHIYYIHYIQYPDHTHYNKLVLSLHTHTEIHHNYCGISC